MFKLVFLTKRLIAPLILLAERSSRVWLISNQGVWTRLLPWPSFSFVNPRRPLDKRAFTPRHWRVSPGIPKGPVQTLALVLVVLGGILFKGFVCWTRVQLPQRSTGYQYSVWHMFQLGTGASSFSHPVCVLSTYYVANTIEMVWPRAV